MSTTIRPTVSKRNPYYISKHRYYELKHFCLQYRDWKRAYAELLSAAKGEGTDEFSDPTGDLAVVLSGLSKSIELVETSAKMADPEIAKYILMAVTEGKSFSYLEGVLRIPCGRDMFYDRYRRFFYILSKEKRY